MIRRRKGNFKPILPRPGLSNAPTQNESANQDQKASKAQKKTSKNNENCVEDNKQVDKAAQLACEVTVSNVVKKQKSKQPDTKTTVSPKSVSGAKSIEQTPPATHGKVINKEAENCHVVVSEQQPTITSPKHADLTSSLSTEIISSPSSPTLPSKVQTGFHETVHKPHQSKLPKALVCSVKAAKNIPFVGKQPREMKATKQRIALSKLKKMELNKITSQEHALEWENIDRNVLSMSDLIYINPPEQNGKELGIRAKLREMKVISSERVNSAENSPAPASSNSDVPTPQEAATSVEHEDDEETLVPQLRVNDHGLVVLDEESLTVKSPSRPGQIAADSPAVYESGLRDVNQCSFRRRPIAKTHRWSQKQTAKFYAALRVVGADFGLMSAMFRNRNRDELRRKYHLESKKNLWKIDEALSQQHLSKWSNEMFLQGSSSDDETVSKKTRVSKRNKLTTKDTSETISEPPIKYHKRDLNTSIINSTTDSSIYTNEGENLETDNILIDLASIPQPETDIDVTNDVLNSIINDCEVTV